MYVVKSCVSRKPWIWSRLPYSWRIRCYWKPFGIVAPRVVAPVVLVADLNNFTAFKRAIQISFHRSPLPVDSVSTGSQNCSSDVFCDLWYNCVSKPFKSVHPMGNPIRYSTHLTGGYAKLNFALK